MEYASNGKGNLGVTLGAIGTGLSTLGSMGILPNMVNTGNSYVTKDMLDLQLKLVASDKENAILKADLNTETKIVDAFKSTLERENKIRDELKTEIKELDRKVSDNAAAQAVINCQHGSQINLNTSQIAQLFSLTKMVVPNTSVCPGWGPTTITPTVVTTGTTIA